MLLDAEERAVFASFLMDFFGHLDAERGWTKQLHLGAHRNVNTRALPIDSARTPVSIPSAIGRRPGARRLSRPPGGRKRLAEDDHLQRESRRKLCDRHHGRATFRTEASPGKIQFGSAWWFLDQKEGMEDQMNTLSNVGLLSRFVGMLTDSRSFMSFPRHEYFRRILCNLFGSEIESGEIPDREDWSAP